MTPKKGDRFAMGFILFFVCMLVSIWGFVQYESKLWEAGFLVATACAFGCGLGMDASSRGGNAE